MLDDLGFVRDMIDHPNDPTVRLIYSDWLEERGRDREAAWHRDIAGRMKPYGASQFNVAVRAYKRSGGRTYDTYGVTVDPNGEVRVRGTLGRRARTIFEATYTCWAGFTAYPINKLDRRWWVQHTRAQLWQPVLYQLTPEKLVGRYLSINIMAHSVSCRIPRVEGERASLYVARPLRWDDEDRASDDVGQ